MYRTTFIPAETFDALTDGLAADMAKLNPEVDGSIAHKVAEVLSGYGLFPNSVSTQIIDDIHDSYRQQIEAAVPAAL